MEQGGASGNAIGDGAHPSGGATWRRWRMLPAAVFNGGEATTVMDDIDSVALQCRGRREKVRGEPIWTERERAVMLTDDGGWRRCLGGNQRGGGVSDGGSRRGEHVGGGEGGELKLRHGCGTEGSEVPAASSDRWARGCRVEEGKLERERVPRERHSAARGEGRGQQWPPVVGRGRRHYCVNRGERRGTSDAALHD
jgi:hypothetical protein